MIEIKIASVLDGGLGDTHLCKEGKAATLLYKSPGVGRIEAPGFIRLDPEACIYHAHRLQSEGHERLDHYVKMITGRGLADFGDSWKDADRGCYEQSHLFGRLDITLKLFEVAAKAKKKISLFWVMPEAGLHPAWCCGLGDAIVRMGEEYDDGK